MRVSASGPKLNHAALSRVASTTKSDVEFAELLDKQISDRIHRHVARQQPRLRQEREGGAELEDFLLEAVDRARFHVGDDDDVRALAGLGRVVLAGRMSMDVSESDWIDVTVAAGFAGSASERA
jgi:GAF domain-containing protein